MNAADPPAVLSPILPAKRSRHITRHAPWRKQRKYPRTEAQKIEDVRWDRIYREKFEDPDYYGVHLNSQSPQHDL